MKKLNEEKGYTLVEIIITMSITAIVVVSMTLSIFTFRNNVQYDILLNKIIESANYAKLKSMIGKLDSQGQRSSYSVKFLEGRIVEFEGDVYTEGAASNIEYEVPVGLRLSSICLPQDNGTVTFAAITGENSNTCNVYIYKFEEATPMGSVVIGKFGVEQAS